MRNKYPCSNKKTEVFTWILPLRVFEEVFSDIRLSPLPTHWWFSDEKSVTLYRHSVFSFTGKSMVQWWEVRYTLPTFGYQFYRHIDRVVMGWPLCFTDIRLSLLPTHWRCSNEKSVTLFFMQTLICLIWKRLFETIELMHQTDFFHECFVDDNMVFVTAEYVILKFHKLNQRSLALKFTNETSYINMSLFFVYIKLLINISVS